MAIGQMAKNKSKKLVAQETGPAAPSVDAKEVAHFAAISGSWWDESGPFAALHALNPVRIGFLRDRARDLVAPGPGADTPLTGLRWLDVGCGGGLLAEPLTRLGAAVTGVDAGEDAIRAARAHAELVGLRIKYRCDTAECLAAENLQFDCVSAMEILEHVADVPAFLKSCKSLMRPGGLFFFSTLSRTIAALLLAKIGAEYIFRMAPRGSHDWRKFLRPSELAVLLGDAGFHAVEFRGMVFDPLRGTWRESRNLDINYMGLARA